MFVYVGALECVQATGRIINGSQMLVSLSTEAGPADSLIIDIDCISNCLDQIRQAQGRASK